jgi:hypothetical protein
MSLLRGIETRTTNAKEMIMFGRKISRTLAVAVGVGVLFCWTAAAKAAPFGVYYRSSNTAAWTLYATTSTQAAAQTTAAALTDLGYLSSIVDVAVSPPVSSVTVVLGSDGGYGDSGWWSSSWWSAAHSSWAHSGSHGHHHHGHHHHHAHHHHGKHHGKHHK